MLKEYDPVKAVRDLNSEVLKGSKGTIVMIYDSPTLGYEVEFFNDAGETIGVLTVNPDDIAKLISGVSK